MFTRPVSRLVLLLAAASCGKQKTDAPPAADVVARIGGEVITVADIEAEIGSKPAFVRARYQAPERKKEFLDGLVRWAVMAREARNLGFDRDPDVQRAWKREMINKMIERDFEEKTKTDEPSDAEIEAYYKERGEEFQRPDQVRVNQIFTTDAAKAERLAREARALAAKLNAQKERNDRPYNAFVFQNTDDKETRARAGDLGFFDRETTKLPKEVVEAAFAIKDVGDVAGPVKSAQGFHVLRLVQKRPGFSRPLAEVKPELIRRIKQERRAKQLQAWIDDMHKRYKIEVFEDRLAQVKIDTTEAPAEAAKMPPVSPLLEPRRPVLEP